MEALKHVSGEALETPHYWQLQTQALSLLGDEKAALGAARRGLELEPEHLTLLLLLGMAQGELRDLAAAELTFLRGLELSPEHPIFLKHYALLLAEGGQFVKAQKVMAEAVRIVPEDSGVKQGQVRLAYLRGQHKEVERYTRELLEDDPENTVARTFRGLSLAEKRRLGAAREQLSDVARDNPHIHALGDLVRDYRDQTHWLLAPLWVFRRFGSIKVWLVVLTLAASLGGMGFPTLGGLLAMLYFFLVIYSWTVPPLLRLYLRRRR